MKIKDQILSIKQVRELQRLGFDIEKYTSVRSTGEEVIIEDDFYIGAAPLFPTMTIGDIIEVLPEKIKTYSANADKEIYFYLRINNSEIIYIPLITDDFIGCCSNEDKLINNLFNTLVWCIKNKYITL